MRRPGRAAADESVPKETFGQLPRQQSGKIVWLHQFLCFAGELPQTVEQWLIVDDARHFMLAAELSAPFHPFSEGAALNRDHLRWSEAEATGPMRTVVVISSAQARIQRLSERLDL